MMTNLLILVAAQAMSLLLGSTGIFFLWASFYVPEVAAHAVGNLITASAIVYFIKP
jgi:hypothetical protein